MAATKHHLLSSALLTYSIRCSKSLPGCNLAIEDLQDADEASASEAERYFIEKGWRVVEEKGRRIVVCKNCFGLLTK